MWFRTSVKHVVCSLQIERKAATERDFQSPAKRRKTTTPIERQLQSVETDCSCLEILKKKKIGEGEGGLKMVPHRHQCGAMWALEMLVVVLVYGGWCWW
jgi:hypothetical protein